MPERFSSPCDVGLLLDEHATTCDSPTPMTNAVRDHNRIAAFMMIPSPLLTSPVPVTECVFAGENVTHARSGVSASSAELQDCQVLPATNGRVPATVGG